MNWTLCDLMGHLLQNNNEVIFLLSKVQTPNSNTFHFTPELLNTRKSKALGLLTARVHPLLDAIWSRPPNSRPLKTRAKSWSLNFHLNSTSNLLKSKMYNYCISTSMLLVTGCNVEIHLIELYSFLFHLAVKYFYRSNIFHLFSVNFTKVWNFDLIRWKDSIYLK